MTDRQHFSQKCDQSGVKDTYRFDPRTQTTQEIWREKLDSARVLFSQDGRFMVMMKGPFFEEDRFEIWDVKEKQRKLTIPTPVRDRRMSFLTLTADSKYLAAFEQLKTGSDPEKPFHLWLWDVETGQLRDQVELPKGVMGSLRQPALAAWLEMRTSQIQQDSSGRSVTSLFAGHERTFFDLRDPKPFSKPLQGLAIDPEQERLLVAISEPQTVEIRSLDGGVLSEPIAISGQIIPYPPQFVPHSTLLATQSEGWENLPELYEYVKKLLGRPPTGSRYWAEAALVDWRTGKKLLSCPNRIDPHTSSVGAGVPWITIAPDGRFVAFCYETEKDRERDLGRAPTAAIVVVDRLGEPGWRRLDSGWTEIRKLAGLGCCTPASSKVQLQREGRGIRGKSIVGTRDNP